ncbi:hypothetical protein [Kocuria aegyptia]|uniref:hypothetical protein n=1 Tax=Kocuria aegyptia TaxID=330943 RepID=UPI0031DE85F6
MVAKTGIARTTLYRHLPPRPLESVTAGPVTVVGPDPGPTGCPDSVMVMAPQSRQTTAVLLPRCLGWIDFRDPSAVRR